MLCSDFQLLTPAIALWHAYDPNSKAELFSTAFLTPQGLLLVDPIPLAASAEDELLRLGPVAGIVVTNGNHWRASDAFARKWKTPVFGHNSLTPPDGVQYHPLDSGDPLPGSVGVLALPGAAPGEIALHLPERGGTLIMGDALIHFDPYGFTFLPAKYCTDHKQMRLSLRQLLACPAERMLFAHGEPISANLKTRLEHLLHDT